MKNCIMRFSMMKISEIMKHGNIFAEYMVGISMKLIQRLGENYVDIMEKLKAKNIHGALNKKRRKIPLRRKKGVYK